MLGSPWCRDDGAGLVPCVRKGRKAPVGFCVPQTSSPTSLAPAPHERPVWGRARLGLRGRRTYVRPAVSPAAPGSPATAGVEGGAASAGCTTLKRQRNVPCPSRSPHPSQRAATTLSESAVVSAQRWLQSRHLSAPPSPSSGPWLRHQAVFCSRVALHNQQCTQALGLEQENQGVRSGSAIYQLCGLGQVKLLEPQLSHL